MKFLFVFDDSIDIKGVAELGISEESEVALFPLTGNWRLIRQVESFVRSQKAMCVVLLNTANMVDSKVDSLCRVIPEWSARCGELRIGRKTVREHFLLPGGGPSTFWFGPLSEKNPLKTDSFLLLAQAQAVEEEIQEGAYDCLAVKIRSSLLKESMRRIAEKQNVQFETRSGHCTLWEKFEWFGLIEIVFFALTGWLQSVVRALAARFVMGSLPSRYPEKSALLSVTYFPYLDKKAASEGRFENKYFAPLQQVMIRQRRGFFWLLIFVHIDGGSFRESLKTARRLADQGERLAFMEEFIGFKEAVTILAWMMVNIFRYVRLERKIDTAEMCGGLAVHSCLPIVRDLWRRSFCGLECLRGMISYLAFTRALRFLPKFKECVYLCEMQIWEKAFVAASRNVCPEMKSIGFEHTSVSKNYTFFKHAPSEIDSSNQPDGIPLPHVLACNGRLAKKQLAESGYSGLIEVEALRQLHLSGDLPLETRNRGALHILLVAGSIVREETKALLSFINESSPDPEKWEVWLKGHPSMPMDVLLREMEIDPSQMGWVVKEGDIRPFLGVAEVVVVPTSTVAIEALAFGCEVVVPVFSTFFSMSPLLGFDHFCRKVYRSEEFETALEDYLKNGPAVGAQDKKDFVHDYWHLDSGLPRWKELLEFECHHERDM